MKPRLGCSKVSTIETMHKLSSLRCHNERDLKIVYWFWYRNIAWPQQFLPHNRRQSNERITKAMIFLFHLKWPSFIIICVWLTLNQEDLVNGFLRNRPHKTREKFSQWSNLSKNFSANFHFNSLISIGETLIFMHLNYFFFTSFCVWLNFDKSSKPNNKLSLTVFNPIDKMK